DFNYTFGVANIPNTFDMLDVQGYTSLYQESHNAHPAYSVPGWFNPDSANATTPYQQYLGNKPTIDWQEPFIRNNAANVDASARIYGGTDNTNYYVSMGYSFIEAPIIQNDQERYSFATNINTKVAKWIDVGVTYRLSYVDVTNNSNSLSEGTQTPPWQPIYIEDDYYPINSPIEDKFGYATVSDTTTTPNPDHPLFGGSNADAPPYNVGYQFKYGNRTWMNRAALLDPRINESKYAILRNIGNAFVKFKLYKGLTVKAGMSLDYYHNRRENWTYIGRDMYNITPGNPYATGDGLTTVGSLGYRNSYNQNIVKDITIDYVESFGDHNINITLNAMDQQYSYRMISSSSEYITQEDPEKRGFIENQDYTTVGEWNDRNALQGYMARASYNYASKYYLDATIRRDGTSRFAPDYRWGTFPSFALAWRMSGENFMSGLSWLNDLKWRFGWGQLGNQETAAFAWLSGVNRSPQYQFGSGNGNTTNALFMPDFPTEDLSWETATTINFGFDGIFLNNRLTATVEYYNRLTEDILQRVSFPSSVGNYSDPIINIASVENKGFEFQLGWRDNIGDVEYFVNGNLTTSHNEVIEVWNDQPFTVDSDRIPDSDTDGRIEEGFPLYYIWGYETSGIFQDQDEIDDWYETHTGDAEADAALVGPEIDGCRSFPAQILGWE
ncbi:TonB-dependent receptor domain-containing protein, partial [Bacteroidota bacterium]